MAQGYEGKVQLSFNVIPNSHPPSNLQILIGRNGSGKTTIITKLINTLLKEDTSSEFGEFSGDILIADKIFPVVVNVSFSAFDGGNKKVYDIIIENVIKYFYIGLKKKNPDSEENLIFKNPGELTNEFIISLIACKKNLLVNRWKTAIYSLESDSNFKDEDIISLIQDDDSIEDPVERQTAFISKANSVFTKLSSGHKIVLLTITRLVELVEEKTLVLIDEPETHLHPPLLSAFIRSLSDLLINRNGVALIATHSPVVLQEVPSFCVWKLIRNGSLVEAKRLRIETFGESVGTLTYEVFRLEVTNSGFHKRLIETVATSNSYEEVLGKFHNQLGLEGKAILRSLMYDKLSQNAADS